MRCLEVVVHIVERAERCIVALGRAGGLPRMMPFSPIALMRRLTMQRATSGRRSNRQVFASCLSLGRPLKKKASDKPGAVQSPSPRQGPARPSKYDAQDQPVHGHQSLRRFFLSNCARSQLSDHRTLLPLQSISLESLPKLAEPRYRSD